MCTNMVIPLLDLDLVHGHTRLMLEETGTQMMVCMQATSNTISSCVDTCRITGADVAVYVITKE